MLYLLATPEGVSVKKNYCKIKVSSKTRLIKVYNLFQTSSGLNYLLITVGNSLYFPGVEYIRQYVERAAKKQGGCVTPVAIDCRYVLGNRIVLLLRTGTKV